MNSYMLKNVMSPCGFLGDPCRLLLIYFLIGKRCQIKRNKKQGKVPNKGLKSPREAVDRK
jgi:hypothetical protein